MKKLASLSAALLTAGSLALLTPASPAEAACTAHKVPGKSYWTCVTPGAYCPAAAHNKIGYGKAAPHRKYKCLEYSSDSRWHWKRA